MSLVEYSVLKKAGVVSLFAKTEGLAFKFNGSKFVRVSDIATMYDFADSSTVTDDEAMRISSGALPPIISDVQFSVFDEDGPPETLFAESCNDAYKFDGSKFVHNTSYCDYFRSTSITKEEAMRITSGAMPPDISEPRFSVCKKDGYPSKLFARLPGRQIYELIDGEFCPLKSIEDWWRCALHVTKEEAMKLSSGVMPPRFGDIQIPEVEYSVYLVEGKSDKVFANAYGRIWEFRDAKYHPLSSLKEYKKSLPVVNKEAMRITAGVRPPKNSREERIKESLKKSENMRNSPRAHGENGIVPSIFTKQTVTTSGQIRPKENSTTDSNGNPMHGILNLRDFNRPTQLIEELSLKGVQKNLAKLGLVEGVKKKKDSQAKRNDKKGSKEKAESSKQTLKNGGEESPDLKERQSATLTFSKKRLKEERSKGRLNNRQQRKQGYTEESSALFLKYESWIANLLGFVQTVIIPIIASVTPLVLIIALIAGSDWITVIICVGVIGLDVLALLAIDKYLETQEPRKTKSDLKLEVKCAQNRYHAIEEKYEALKDNYKAMEKKFAELVSAEAMFEDVQEKQPCLEITEREDRIIANHEKNFSNDVKYSVFKKSGDVALFAVSGGLEYEFDGYEFVPISKSEVLLDFGESSFVTEEEAMRISSGKMPPMSDVKYSVLDEAGVVSLFAWADDELLKFNGSEFVPVRTEAGFLDFRESTVVTEVEAMQISSGVKPQKKKELLSTSTMLKTSEPKVDTGMFSKHELETEFDYALKALKMVKAKFEK